MFTQSEIFKTLHKRGKNHWWTWHDAILGIAGIFTLMRHYLKDAIFTSWVKTSIWHCVKNGLDFFENLTNKAQHIRYIKKRRMTRPINFVMCMLLKKSEIDARWWCRYSLFVCLSICLAIALVDVLPALWCWAVNRLSSCLKVSSRDFTSEKWLS